MDRQTLRTKLLEIFEQETWERPENLTDEMKIREGLKLDSVDMLSIALRLETELGVTLGGDDFGHIQIKSDFSLVELPAELPAEVFDRLANTRISGQLIELQPDSGRPRRRSWDDGDRRPARKPRHSKH